VLPGQGHRSDRDGRLRPRRPGLGPGTARRPGRHPGRPRRHRGNPHRPGPAAAVRLPGRRRGRVDRQRAQL